MVSGTGELKNLLGKNGERVELGGGVGMGAGGRVGDGVPMTEREEVRTLLI